MIKRLNLIKTGGLFLYLVLNSLLLPAQELPVYKVLSSSNPNDEFDDLEQLDSFFEGVQIIGMGESTHGTHEFNTMRLRFFKYLVLNHNFNTLFLEADYANCLLANDYVHGANIDKYEALNNLALWPWVTEEMGDMFDWMREYNLKKPSKDQLSFIGVDTQQYNSTLAKIDKLLIKYEIQATDTSLYKSITEAEFYKLKKKEIQPFFDLLNQKSNVDIRNFSDSDKLTYQLLVRHFGQILDTQKNSKDYSYRDKKMAENILYHLEKKEPIKGLFWAHNGHLFNVFSIKKGEMSGRAGGILKYKLQDKFKCVIQEFDEGSFNAYHKPNANLKDTSHEGYKLGPVTIEESISNSFGARFRIVLNATPYIFIDADELKTEEDINLQIHTIGALFVSEKKNPKQTNQYNSCTRKCFDGMVLIKNSTPTHLIE